MLLLRWESKNISIHAPTKGATAGALNKPMSQMISIHAPTKGATLSVANSVAGIPISIHAPTKGATLRNIFAYQLLLISIHAPTKGATAILSNFTSYIFQFPLIFTNIFLLIFYLYHLPITFVHLFWCESSYTTVSTCHSHNNHIIRTSSTEIPLSTPTCSIFVLY